MCAIPVCLFNNVYYSLYLFTNVCYIFGHILPAVWGKINKSMWETAKNPDNYKKFPIKKLHLTAAVVTSYSDKNIT